MTNALPGCGMWKSWIPGKSANPRLSGTPNRTSLLINEWEGSGRAVWTFDHSPERRQARCRPMPWAARRDGTRRRGSGRRCFEDVIHAGRWHALTSALLDRRGFIRWDDPTMRMELLANCIPNVKQVPRDLSSAGHVVATRRKTMNWAQTVAGRFRRRKLPAGPVTGEIGTMRWPRAMSSGVSQRPWTGSAARSGCRSI